MTLDDFMTEMGEIVMGNDIDPYSYIITSS